MQIIIPMTGYGSRFVAAGYKDLKPFIKIDGKTILEWIVGGMYAPSDEFLFVCRKEHLDAMPFMEGFLHKLAPNTKILAIDDWVKKGPVFDVMRCEGSIGDNEPAIINYCDFYMIWDRDKFYAEASSKGWDGAIPSYTGFHPHLIPEKNVYASSKTGKDGRLIEIKEKHSFHPDKRKAYHSAGTYYFKTGKLLKKYCEKLIADKDELNGEYYASMVYNNMVKDGLYIAVPKDIKYFCQWGTPEDLQDFLFWYDNIKGWTK